MTRHAHSTGHHVERRFGWDTHGLPVEHEIDQKLGITGKEDVLKMGIEAYNAECRAIVRRSVQRFGARDTDRKAASDSQTLRRFALPSLSLNRSCATPASGSRR